MPTIQIVTESELRSCVNLNLEVVDLIDNAFATLAGGKVIMPPILNLEIAKINAEVDVKTAYVPGLDGFAIKVSPGFFNNPSLGLPSLNGLMVVLDSTTGVVKSVLLDNGYLTAIRTAAAGAVAARHLATQNLNTVAVIGAGEQATLQIKALSLVRNFNHLLVWARSRNKAENFITQMQQQFDCKFSLAPSIAHAVNESQFVVTTTAAKQPLISLDHIHENLHITAMGSDTSDKCELDPHLYRRADRYIVDSASQSLKQGELRPVLEMGLINASDQIDELGEIAAHLKPARQSENELTICDLTGTGMQDTAIADYASKQVQQHSLGTSVAN